MGLFSKKPQYVQVNYHDLATRSHDGANRNPPGYTFRWTQKTQPAIGQWVWIDGYEGATTGIIVSLTPGSGVETKPVIRPLTNDELAQFHKVHEYRQQQKARNLLIWIEQARQKAGFEPRFETPNKAPEPYDAIPPTKGTIKGSAAKERGKTWWRLYNLAQEHGLPADEVARFKEIADGWYARSRAKN